MVFATFIDQGFALQADTDAATDRGTAIMLLDLMMMDFTSGAVTDVATG